MRQQTHNAGPAPHRMRLLAAVLAIVVLAPPVLVKAQPRRGRDAIRFMSRRTRSTSKYHISVKRAFHDIAARAQHSTVAVFCEGKQVVLGTVVDKQGHVVTKASELHGKVLCRTRSGAGLAAEVVATDKTNDLALLKVDPKGLAPVAWAEDDNPPLGSWVVTPGMGPEALAIGVVSVRERRVPTSRIRTPDRGFLGVQFDTGSEQPKIDRIFPNTGAARAGLRRGDLITAAGETKTPSRDALIDVLKDLKPGDEIRLHVQRGRRSLSLKATLGRWFSGRQLNPQEHMGGELSMRADGFDEGIQHDTVLRPEDCGGPALNSSGQALGVNIARAGRVESFVLPASLVRKIVAKLLAKRPAKQQATTRPAPAKASPKS